jgi:transcriptional regulator with XRE-family HTH domain
LIADAFPIGCGTFLKVAEMESFGVLFGRLIREKRGIEGLSQDDLAGKSGLTKARISDIETGKINNPQAKTVDALCVALGISREERDACRIHTGPRLPPRLLENLALRFGLANPDACETELEAFLKEKALEFREFQERLAKIDATEARITEFLAAANAALEEGNFQLADRSLAEAEEFQLTSVTIPTLERQYSLRLKEDMLLCSLEKLKRQHDIGRSPQITFAISIKT